MCVCVEGGGGRSCSMVLEDNHWKDVNAVSQMVEYIGKPS